MSGRAPLGCGKVTISESPPPAMAPAEVTALGNLIKLAPLSVDFHASGAPGAAEYRQLCESARMLGSASPVEPGKVRFAANVAGAAGAGGLYAAGPAVCLVNHVMAVQFDSVPH